MTPSDAPAVARPDAPLARALSAALDAAVLEGEPAWTPCTTCAPSTAATAS
jgi:hypothetical protein